MDYVGLRWYKCDFHLHTMSSRCYLNKSDTVDQWLDEVQKKGLNCIAVTDHNDYRAIDKISEEAKNRGIIVFPGVEVTCDTSKIHVLVLFDVDKTSYDVSDFLSCINISPEKVGDSEGTTLSILDVCKKAKEKHCIVIPAHIDDNAGLGGMSDTSIRTLLDGKYVDAFQVVNSSIWDSEKSSHRELIDKKYGGGVISDEKLTTWRKAYELVKETGFPIIMSSDNPSEVDKKKHGLWGIGNDYTWIKMGDSPNLECLRQAFFAYDERIRTSERSAQIPEKLPDYWIKSISINKVVINPPGKINAKFNPQLNSIIGGRGSGKSTIIRMLTGVLRSGDFNDLQAIKAEQDDFFRLKDRNGKGMLQNESTVEVEVYRNGLLYKITEKITGKTLDTTVEKYDNTRDEWIPEETDYVTFFKVDAYTQKQIYELAQTPYALSKLIDRDIDGLPELVSKSHELRDNYTQAIRNVRESEEKIRTESHILLQLKDINEQIDAYKKSGITIAIEEKEKYETDNKELNEYAEKINSVGKSLIEWCENNQIIIPSYSFDDEIKKIITSTTELCENKINEVRKAGESLIEQSVQLLNSIDKTQWKDAFNNSIKKYEDAKNSLEKQGLETNKLDELLLSKNQKEAELQAVQALKSEIDLIVQAKNSAEEKYEQSLREIRESRMKFIETVLDGKHDIIIEYLPEKNSKSVEDLLLSYIVTSSQNILDDITKLSEIAVENDGLVKFREIIRNSYYDLETDEVSKYFKTNIKKCPETTIDQIMSFIPEDELQVSYKAANGNYVPLVTASPGQKTTAILSFVLAYGEKPLLLDQPEDDLDNRLVYDLVVKQLKESKCQRQIIVVTHNANIPVNGDSEFIISMDSASKYARVKCSGTMDNKKIRDEICDVMEGTEYAFEMRAKKYHLKNI